MSRPRTRPTREQTREQLLRAAAKVFSRRGIGETSIEDICDEAGYSRGAFYSSFAAKNELIIALLDLHMATSNSSIEKLFAASEDSTDFIDSMESNRRERSGPLDFDDGWKLYIELLLYAMRDQDSRPKVIAHHRALRDANKQVIERVSEDLGREYPVPVDEIVSIVMALDIGMNLNQMIDPELYRPTQFSESLGVLHRMWLAAPEGALDE